MDRYRIDLAALSETRLADEGQLREVKGGYTIFWSGKPKEAHRESGVGFAIKTCLLSKTDSFPKGISDRIITVRLGLSRNQHATVISVYAPTMTQNDAVKDLFYEDLRSTLKSVPRHDKIILMGDFNARVGSDFRLWDGVLGKHGIGKMNSNGLLLLTLCQEFQLAITNTMFQQKNIYKGTWKHPRSKTWHMIDYVIVRQRDLRDVCNTRVMRGADCWSDHRMLRSEMALRFRRSLRTNATKLPQRLDVKKLAIPLMTQKLQDNFTSLFAKVEDNLDSLDVSDHWLQLKTALYAAAKDTVGNSVRRNQDWFDDSDDLIQALLTEKRAAQQACLQQPSSEPLRVSYQALRRTLQMMLRDMRDHWWAKKAEKIQTYADMRDFKSFYVALKEVYGPRSDSIQPILASDGHTLLVDKDKILARWAEHFNSLLNTPSVVEFQTFTALPQEPIQVDLDMPPSLEEIEAAIHHLSIGKSPGMDGIPAELLKAGGKPIALQLRSLFDKIWMHGSLPNELRDASIVHLYKRKGPRSVCDNHRGISLLSVPGKVLAKVIAHRLYKFVADPFLSESQCGFRPGRGCVDMIFTARQLMEKCREQNLGLCAAFIDLTKAFDSVNRQALWLLLEKRGCPGKFLKIIREFHDGMSVRVMEHGSASDSFPVANGVKQGCTMAPTLFAIYFAAMLRDAFQHSNIGVYIQYRTDGKLFNLRRLQARTKILEAVIRDLLFADDCGLFTNTAEDMQLLLNSFAVSARRFGLTINVRKTQILCLPVHGIPAIPPSIIVNGNNLEVVDSFTYLGSNVATDCSLDTEITSRIAKATQAFGALHSKLWNKRGIRCQTKLQVYQSVVLSTLLYASETWTYYRRHIRMLDRFHQSCLRKILHIRWQDRISDVEVLQRANTTGIEAMLMKVQLRWAGHVVRMDDKRLPKQVFYSQIKNAKREPGGQKQRYKDNLKATLKTCQINITNWEDLSRDRSNWRHLIHSSVARFEVDRVASLTRKRENRKNRAVAIAAAVSSSNIFSCSTCGKICLSRIGLVGHQRVH